MIFPPCVPRYCRIKSIIRKFHMLVESGRRETLMVRKIKLVTAILLSFIFQLSVNIVAGTDFNNISQPDLVGIWQMCYDPNESVENDNGYLIIEPNGTYLRMTNDYTWEKLQSVESGNYKIKGNMIVFFPTQQKTLETPKAQYFKEEKLRWKQYELQYMRNIRVVLSNRRQPENRTILRWIKSINYSYAKIY